MNLNLSFIKDMLMTSSCYFDHIKDHIILNHIKKSDHIKKSHHIKKFRCYLNCQHASNKFTSEIEQSDVRFTTVDNSFFTSIYCKVIFSGVFTNFESFLLYLSYK